MNSHNLAQRVTHGTYPPDDNTHPAAQAIKQFLQDAIEPDKHPLMALRTAYFMQLRKAFRSTQNKPSGSVRITGLFPTEAYRLMPPS